jgi:hypothetical protein
MSLLTDIARCPIVEQCLKGENVHPCSKIVGSQGVATVEAFQSPEPWSGHISKAPILFLSSNPSIGITSEGQYPRSTWDDESIEDYFENRFGGSSLSSVANGIYDHLSNGERASTFTRYWAGVRSRAAEILGKAKADVIPGTDYALSEAVRCKSTKEIGVTEALDTCVALYLDPTLRASAAKVIVVVGSEAEKAIRRHYALTSKSSLHGPIEIAKARRYLVFLPHPNGYAKQKTLAGCLSDVELTELREWVS